MLIGSGQVASIWMICWSKEEDRVHSYKYVCDVQWNESINHWSRANKSSIHICQKSTTEMHCFREQKPFQSTTSERTDLSLRLDHVVSFYLLIVFSPSDVLWPILPQPSTNWCFILLLYLFVDAKCTWGICPESDRLKIPRPPSLFGIFPMSVCISIPNSR